jgi:SAM-dependent methyltransferase
MIADSVPPVSEDIPVDMDLDTESLSNLASSDGSNDDVPTNPRLPLDSEEIRIDEALSVDRISETGEVEVSAEDLVSVESMPAPGHAPPPLKTAGQYPAFKDDTTPEPQAATPTPITASALMQGVAPSPSPSRPAMQAVHVPIATNPNAPSTPPPAPVVATTPHAPSVIASPVAQVPPVAMAAPPPAAAPSPMPMHPQGGMAAVTGGMAARRQSNPLIFVPPVGGLAPPPMTDTAAHRKKTRPWWEELFNDDFIRTMAKVTDAQIGKEVNFIEESLGCEAGAMILDLACGTGRHAVELAARGYQVVGFDLSLAMLARASDEAQDRKQKINFVQGDMREMTFEETFDGVYSWNTSFGYFDEEKNGAVIARVHKSLKKGGQFLLDVVNRDYIVRQAPSLAWFEGDGCICMDEMTIDFITSRMKVKRTLMMDDGRTKEIEYSVRVYALHELGKMLHDNGFRVAEVSGRTGTPGVFFGCESPRTLILAEKR